jgi:hypothetical protein
MRRVAALVAASALVGSVIVGCLPTKNTNFCWRTAGGGPSNCVQFGSNLPTNL